MVNEIYRGVKSVSGVNRRTNAAMSRAEWKRSSMLTTSFGECMYRFGMEMSPVGTPLRDR